MRKISHPSAKYGHHGINCHETREEIPYIEFCENQSKMWIVYTHSFKPIIKL